MTELELFFPVQAPVIIVTPYGFGVSGKHLARTPAAVPRRRRPVAPQRDRVPPLEADALARTAMLAVRQVAPRPASRCRERAAAKALAPGPAPRTRRQGRRHLGLVGRSSRACRCWPGGSTVSGWVGNGVERRRRYPAPLGCGCGRLGGGARDRAAFDAPVAEALVAAVAPAPATPSSISPAAPAMSPRRSPADVAHA